MALFDRAVAASLPLVPRFLMRRLSRRYIAGEQRGDALAVALRLRAAGYRLTFDVLGEAVHDRAGVQAAAAEYLALLEELVRGGLKEDLYLSLKPTQMGLNLGEDFCYETVARVAETASALLAFVRFEMEDSPTTDATLRVFERLRRRFAAGVGCVLQSRLRRSAADARALLQSAEPLNVRVVKGIYMEPPDIAFQDGGEVNDSYLRIVRILLEGGARVAAATHDEALVAGVRGILAERPDFAPRVEVQMLLGVREELRRQVRAQGLPVRVYLPYGKEWLPYVRRRLRKNPRLATYALLGLFARRERLESAA